jgi:hypothetical protein
MAWRNGDLRWCRVMPFRRVRSVLKMTQEQEGYADADGEFDRQGGAG